MALKIKYFPVGPVAANCYIVKDTESGEAFAVDPGEFDLRVDRVLREEGIKELKYILLTHGHFDHINGADKLRSKFGGKIAVHELDANCLRDPQESRGALFGIPSPSFEADIILRDGDRLPLGNGEIEVIHTPGHTVGSVCYKADSCIFSGDTLFHLSWGRTDFPGGSDFQLINSMRKLKAIEGDYKVYPGHEDTTALEYEKMHNPIMKGI